jgi:glycosyltransferase involved in cell wall biosynthesis
MRPVVVSQSEAPGGAERYLTTLYGKLRDFGHDPLLIGHVPGWTESGLPATPAPLGPKWDGRSTLKRLPRLPIERSAVARLADETPASSFHLQFKREQIGLTDKLAERAPVLWTEHGRFKGGTEGRLLAAGYRQAAKRVSTIICVSSAVADDVRQIVGPKVRVVVVPNAIDTSEVHPPSDTERADARRSLGVPEDVPVLAWVSQVHAGKLPMLAVQAASRFPGVTLMAGKGPLADDVRAAADGDRVRFLGFQSDPAALYRAADAFLFTSAGMNEGLPTNSILEAAAHGLPVIANSRSGFAPEIEALGGVIAADEPKNLADAASIAIKDRESRSRRAREWAEQHDLHPWAKVHEEIHKTLGQHQPNTLG